jgi:transcriptional regulator with XRE-family HTH domain
MTMQDHSRNIYRIPRVKANLTQERAAELLPTSVESVRAYETGQTMPPDDIVCRMVIIYDAPELAYQHLMNKSEAARMCLPNVEIRDLPAAMLRLQKEVTDFIKCRDDLIDITCDGVITPEERPRFDQIVGELDDIVAAIMGLKYARTGER